MKQPLISYFGDTTLDPSVVAELLPQDDSLLASLRNARNDIIFNPMLPINIKRIDPTLPLPVYETEGSVGFDLLARTDVTIAPKNLALIPANVIVEVPAEYMLMIAARSSTPRKKGLLVPHGIGVIDHDFCGPDDEILIQVYNFTEKDVTVARGEKIAQGIFVKIGKCEFVEVKDMSRKTRGGFGSTG